MVQALRLIIPFRHHPQRLWTKLQIVFDTGRFEIQVMCLKEQSTYCDSLMVIQVSRPNFEYNRIR